MKQPHFHIRLAFFYGAMFSVIGLYMPFFPFWLESREMSKSEITLLLAGPMFARIIFSPLLSFLIDSYGHKQVALILLLWCALISWFLLPFSEGFYSLLLLITIFGVFWGTVMPVTEAIAMLQVRENGMNYGQVRLWGSLTFILASLIGGWLIDLKGSQIIWLTLTVTLFATLVFSYNLKTSDQKLPNITLRRPSAKNNHSQKLNILPDLKILLTNRIFILFLFAGGLGQASHGFYYGLSALHWHSLGYSGFIIGMLWSVGVISEIVLFIYALRWFKKIRADSLLFWGSFLAIFRWSITAFDPPLWLLFAIQTFHAFSFAMLHIGAVYFISRAVPEKLSATAQGIYSGFAMGSLLGITTLMSGPLYESVSSLGYLAMAATASLAAFLSWHLTKKWHGNSLL